MFKNESYKSGWLFYVQNTIYINGFGYTCIWLSQGENVNLESFKSDLSDTPTLVNSSLDCKTQNCKS